MLNRVRDLKKKTHKQALGKMNSLLVLLVLVGMCQAGHQTIESSIVNRTCEGGYMHDVAGFIDYWYLASCVTNFPVSIISMVT